VVTWDVILERYVEVSYGQLWTPQSGVYDLKLLPYYFGYVFVTLNMIPLILSLDIRTINKWYIISKLMLISFSEE
jgi:hypothetical protein